MQDCLTDILCTAGVTSEAIPVQLFAGFRIPQSAGVRCDFVRQNNRSVGQPSELQLEVDQINTEPAWYRFIIGSPSAALR